MPQQLAADAQKLPLVPLVVVVAVAVAVVVAAVVNFVTTSAGRNVLQKWYKKKFTTIKLLLPLLNLSAILNNLQ